MPAGIERHRTRGEAETLAFARRLAERLDAVPLLALSGDLGSGKTVLVRGVCARFGCASQVGSPTFTLVNEYFGSRRVIHCDLYRLRSAAEIADLGLEEYWDGGAVVVIEWAERALDLLPAPRVEVRARHGAAEDEREFRVQTYVDGMQTLLADPETDGNRA